MADGRNNSFVTKKKKKFQVEEFKKSQKENEEVDEREKAFKVGSPGDWIEFLRGTIFIARNFKIVRGSGIPTFKLHFISFFFSLLRVFV